MTAIYSVSASKLRDLQVMERRGETFDYVRGVFGWSTERLSGVCSKNSLQFKDAPTAKQADDVSMRVRLPRSVFDRLVTESEALSVQPGVCVRQILECAFASGELSNLRVPQEVSEL